MIELSSGNLVKAYGGGFCPDRMIEAELKFYSPDDTEHLYDLS